MDASFWLLCRQRNLRKPSLTMSRSLYGRDDLVCKKKRIEDMQVFLTMLGEEEQEMPLPKVITTFFFIMSKIQ